MLDKTNTVQLEAQKLPFRVGYLFLNNGRCIASNHYGDCGLNRHNQWAWIVGHLVGALGCNPEDMSCVETSEGDRIALSGKIVGELVIE